MPSPKQGKPWVGVAIATSALFACGTATAATTPAAAESGGVSDAQTALIAQAERDFVDRTAEFSNEDFPLEAEQYAADKAVTLEAARQALRSQMILEPLAATVDQLVPSERFAGVSFGGGARLDRVRVRMTPGGIPAALQQLIANHPQDFVIETDAVASLADRLAYVDSMTDTWKGQLEEVATDALQGVYADELSDSIVLHVASDAVAALGSRAQVEQLVTGEEHGTLDGADMDDLVHVESVARAEDHNKGGRDMRSCTSGFAVTISGSSPALLTAGHCSLPQPYYWFSGDGPFATTAVGSRWNTYADFRWVRPTEHAVQPRFYGMSQSGDGTIQKKNGENIAPSYKCHRGKTTGATCGDVINVKYKPTYSGACPGGPCEARFVYATGGALRTAGGDSGGPWFLGGVPYGIHKGGGDTGTRMWYSKLGNLPSSVKIWVG